MKLLRIRIPRVAIFAIVIFLYLTYKHITSPVEDRAEGQHTEIVLDINNLEKSSGSNGNAAGNIKAPGTGGDKAVVGQLEKPVIVVDGHGGATTTRRKKPAMCLVSTWEGELPEWKDVFVESMAANSP